MASKKFLDWFLTEKGKKLAYMTAGTATVGVLLGHFLPNTLLIDYYRDFFRQYRKGLTVPVPDKLKNRFDRTMDILEIPEFMRPDYKPFMACGFDIVSAGSSYSRFGVIVGLPAHFEYENVNDVDKSRIKVNQETVVWDSEEGEKLLNSLVVSENAQIYAIAREIKLRQSAKLAYDMLIATVATLGTYALSRTINEKFNFYSKPRSVRMVLYGLCFVLNFGNYLMCKDFTQVYYENTIDKELLEKDQIFAEGGKEFYTKILERNMALRKLLGQEGERMYTVTGNENYLFRNKHTPLVHRKRNFEEYQTLKT